MNDYSTKYDTYKNTLKMADAPKMGANPDLAEAAPHAARGHAAERARRQAGTRG